MSNIPKIPRKSTRQIGTSEAWTVHASIMDEARARRKEREWRNVRDGL